MQTKNDWFSTLRARLGYAADRALIYGTAGGALGDVAAGQSGNFQRVTKGGKQRLTENLTARIEYLYLKLGNSTWTSTVSCGSDLGLPGGTANPNDTGQILHQHDSARPGLQIPLT